MLVTKSFWSKSFSFHFSIYLDQTNDFFVLPLNVSKCTSYRNRTSIATPPVLLQHSYRHVIVKNWETQNCAKHEIGEIRDYCFYLSLDRFCNNSACPHNSSRFSESVSVVWEESIVVRKLHILCNHHNILAVKPFVSIHLSKIIKLFTQFLLIFWYGNRIHAAIVEFLYYITKLCCGSWICLSTAQWFIRKLTCFQNSCMTYDKTGWTHMERIFSKGLLYNFKRFQRKQAN